MRPKPPAVTIYPWLRANLGARCLGPLTGTDARALKAAVQIVEHYSYDPHLNVALAFGVMVQRMQPETRYLAYHAIAHVMDWHNRPELWERARLEPLTNIPRCEYEPKPWPLDQ